LPTLSHVYSTLSLIRYERNDLEGALQHAREAVALARRWEQADALHFAYTNLGSALFASGDVQTAFEILRQAWQVARRTSPWFEEITIAQEVEWHLAQGNVEAAVERLRLAEAELEQSPRADKSLLLALAYPQIFLAQKRYAGALAAMDSLLNELQKRKNHYYLVHVLVWRAMAYQGLGQKAQALAALKHALIPAAPQGFVRAFIAAGPPLVPLLKQARTAGIAPDYVDRLLMAMAPAEQPQPSQRDSDPQLIEPLSAREIEVLKLLARGCRDKQIAETLVIARGTVHKHLKNIYDKLDVHSRTVAIARARDLKLL
jgi:LuxR family maltose regulon positive regulatory protein